MENVISGVATAMLAQVLMIESFKPRWWAFCFLVTILINMDKIFN